MKRDQTVNRIIILSVDDSDFTSLEIQQPGPLIGQSMMLAYFGLTSVESFLSYIC